MNSNMGKEHNVGAVDEWDCDKFVLNIGAFQENHKNTPIDIFDYVKALLYSFMENKELMPRNKEMCGLALFLTARKLRSLLPSPNVENIVTHLNYHIDYACDIVPPADTDIRASTKKIVEFNLSEDDFDKFYNKSSDDFSPVEKMKSIIYFKVEEDINDISHEVAKAISHCVGLEELEELVVGTIANSLSKKQRHILRRAGRKQTLGSRVYTDYNLKGLVKMNGVFGELNDIGVRVLATIDEKLEDVRKEDLD